MWKTDIVHAIRVKKSTHASNCWEVVDNVDPTEALDFVFFVTSNAIEC